MLFLLNYLQLVYFQDKHFVLSVVSLFSRQEFCAFLSVVLCQLVKITNHFFLCRLIAKVFLFLLYPRRDQV